MPNNIFQFLTSASSNKSENGSSDTSGSTEKLTNLLKNMVKSPVFYIVIGAIVLLIIAVYLFRRVVKPSNNAVKVIIRGGKIYKLIDEKSFRYFMVPFKDKLGAVISLSEREFNSDKLFINNGPDALYRINYNLKYKVEDVKKFYQNRDIFQSAAVIRINDALREYADDGHAFDIVEGYRQNNKNILNVIGGAIKDFGVYVTALKINYIEPICNK